MAEPQVKFDYANLYQKSGKRVFRLEPLFPLRVKREQTQPVTVCHRHDFCECVFVIRGRGRHQSEDHRSVSVRRGCVIVIPEGGYHAYTKVSPVFSVINLMFKVTHLPPVLLELYSSAVYKEIFLRDAAAFGDKDYPLIRLKETVFAELESMLGYLLDASSKAGRHCYKLGLFMVILSRLCELWHIPAGEMRQPLDIPRLTVYLDENFRKAVYLEDLTRLTSLSRATLLRHFRSAMGVTPMIYLRNLRLRHAAKLLLNTDFSLKEVADQSGFTSMPYFFRSFRACYGVSPQEYRTLPPEKIR